MTATALGLGDQKARQRIAQETATTLFVEAGAGSGKTTALVNRLLTLVLDDNIPLSRIAAVTFTEKAGAELRDRLRERLDGHREDVSKLRRERAHQAAEDLDAAAIGTLHSFAQRILTMFPIQAGLPPLVEVLDEVASSVAFEARWAVLQTDLLDNPDLAEPLLLALSTGIKLEHLRSLAKAFGSDWDLIADRVLPHQPSRAVLPDLSSLARLAGELAARVSECTDQNDKFIPKLTALQIWGESLSAATSDSERFALLTAGRDQKWGRLGRAANWADLAGLRLQCGSLTEDIARAANAFADATLRPLAYWIAEQVQHSAAERMAEGRLEFHDLLVLSRNLLRRDAEVRAALQRQFPRLLLDEFQDTDPIQIELALRIAAGADATQSNWRDIVIPPGSVFVVGDPKQSIYRFRRADIATYLQTQRHLGSSVTLDTNFRTVEPILNWINAVYGNLIQAEPDAQPPYIPLRANRFQAPESPSVLLLGAQEHADKPNAALLREREARDVAAAIQTALNQQWTTQEQDRSWRPLRASDIVVLIPARTSLPVLENALDAAGLPYRAESSSLVYQASEIRNLMAAARAVANPSDLLSCVTALRSALFGCGDDDLFTWKRDGGSFNLLAPRDPERADHPVGAALAYLYRLHKAARWQTPSEVLTALVVDRRMMEVSAYGSHTRDEWRRLRFVIDQARAWADVEHGSLGEYLAWAARQADETSRVAEAVLPETDVNAIRIMTVHAAKGLEFPMVVLSGMTSQPRTQSGVRLLWTPDGYAVSLSKRMQTNDFQTVQPIDEQMDSYERRRLLYVAATRAKDHLVVSVHRSSGATKTNARLLADAGATDQGADTFTATPPTSPIPAPRRFAEPAPELNAWQQRIEAARERTRYSPAQTASGLEGTEPEIVLPEIPILAGEAKGARNLELPPWAKGRYGDKVGRAVHGVLQTVDLTADRDGIAAIARAQALAEGVTEHTDAVIDLVVSALDAPLVRRAAEREHWRESYVGAPREDGVIVEGFVDLIFREDDGSLVIIDYKTDSIPDAAIPARSVYYAPQILAYQYALTAATGALASGHLLFVRSGGLGTKAVKVV
ncbi:UvrD-helicase domain-containing protein [Kineosporia babensis]|uniref:DNA 3'-5' helicase n=1 Tax=Kineosporia babensis TaxID=499548 RepID=A0A9X1NH31_9ACTN|nr:UvrD-helicase domain-containing protein [Kineosporia babensis]MCD5312993.1 UvrD-helicase domain-containing protein [Kineosporia babensis]